jgi:hypothetical protein
MKKQNIEDIFSSIENLSSVPPPELWDNIEAKLHPSKKKKATIIWWSIAASLLIGLSIPSVLYFNSNTQDLNSLQKNSVVIQEKNGNSDKNNTVSTSKNSLEKSTNNKASETTIVSSETEKQPQSKENNISIQKNAEPNNITDQNDVLKTKTPSKQNTVVNVASTHDKNLKAKTYHIQNSNSNQYSGNSTYIDENLVPKNDATIVSNSKSKEKANISAEKETLSNNPVIVSNTISKNNQKTISQYETESKNNAKNGVSQKEKTNVIVSKNGSSETSTKNKAIASNSTSNTKSNISPTEKIIVIDSKNGSSETLNKNKTIAGNSTSNTKYNISAPEKTNVIDLKNDSPEALNKNKAIASNSTSNTKSNIPAPEKSNVIDLKNDSPEASNKNKTIASNSTSNTKSNIPAPEKSNVIDLKNDSPEASNKNKAIANNSKSGAILTGQDSIQLAVLQNLEKNIAEGKPQKEEDKTKTIPSSEKWSLKVFAGVANSENYKKEKTLGNPNESKQTNTYGVKTNYKLNKKWTVSSGVKINELGQSIANVTYMDTSHESLSIISSSDYLIKNVTTVSQITNNPNYVFVTQNAKNSIKSDNFQTGNIDQSLKYLEIPLEVSYALFNKNKTSISLNTGGVVGKLISNNISLNGTSIGSNSDASDFIYGSLLSSTLQYRIYKKTHVFVEPGMNYYINPLNNQSFNQFQWAFNFGLNVSF